MSELVDYSGEFVPGIQNNYSLFSRQALAGLVRFYARFRVVVDGFWYLVVKDIAGDETAFACDQRIWDNLTARTISQVTDSINIKRDSLTSLLKYFQIMGGPYIMETDLISGNLGRLTVVGCPTLDGLEAEGEGRENHICRILEPALYRRVATCFNPHIKVNPLVLPPRKITTDIPCQWEFELEGGATTGSSERRSRKQALEGKATGLEDYSGPYIPGVRLEDFCKDVLVRMLKAYSRVIFLVDGIWYLTIKDTIDNQTALDCDRKVWERLARYEAELVAGQLNIHQPTVSSFMKYVQIDPIRQNFQYLAELEHENHGIVTTTHCPTLSALEEEGDDREAEICQQMCRMVFNHASHFFNPAIKVTPISIPPRESPDGIAYQWEYKIEE
ncbi:DUF6125 family protein [Chloroflexota bacterium]